MPCRAYCHAVPCVETLKKGSNQRRLSAWGYVMVLGYSGMSHLRSWCVGEVREKFRERKKIAEFIPRGLFARQSHSSMISPSRHVWSRCRSMNARHPLHATYVGSGCRHFETQALLTVEGFYTRSINRRCHAEQQVKEVHDPGRSIVVR